MGEQNKNFEIERDDGADDIRGRHGSVSLKEIRSRNRHCQNEQGDDADGVGKHIYIILELHKIAPYVLRIKHHTHSIA